MRDFWSSVGETLRMSLGTWGGTARLAIFLVILGVVGMQLR